MLQVYVQRLGCDLLNGVAVRKAAGIAFPLAMEMLGDLPALQFPPSLLAAAMLHAARKAQVDISCVRPSALQAVIQKRMLNVTSHLASFD